MNREEKKKNWYEYYKRYNLESLGIWLFGGTFEIISDYLDRDLISIHIELDSSKERALMEVHHLSLTISFEYFTEILNRIIIHGNEKIKELGTILETLEFPPETIYNLKKISGEKIEIEVEMDKGLKGNEIENLHKLSIMPFLVDEIDLEESCAWLDNHFELIKGEFLRFYPTYRVSFQYQVIDYQIEFLESLLDKIILYLPLDKQPESTHKFTHLKEVFKPDEQFEALIEILRKFHPPIIDDTGTYNLGERKKGSIAAFFYVLKKRGKLIPHYIMHLKPLIESFFNMEITRKTLSAQNSKLFNQYKEEFEKLIPQD